MSRIRRSFTKEQKLEIVKQSLEDNCDMLILAKQYALHPNTIYKWRVEYTSKKESAFPGNGNVVLSQEQKELSDLKKQVRELELEKEILKKHWASSRHQAGKICFHKRIYFSISC